MADTKPNVADLNLAEIDFEEVAPATELTKKSVVREVPPNIVAIAQRVLDNQTRETRTFRGNEALAAKFEQAMKDAGNWTTPVSSVTANRDGIVVTYSAGQRRGRKNKSGNGDSSAAK